MDAGQTDSFQSSQPEPGGCRLSGRRRVSLPTQHACASIGVADIVTNAGRRNRPLRDSDVSVLRFSAKAGSPATLIVVRFYPPTIWGQEPQEIFAV